MASGVFVFALFSELLDVKCSVVLWQTSSTDLVLVFLLSLRHLGVLDFAYLLDFNSDKSWTHSKFKLQAFRINIEVN